MQCAVGLRAKGLHQPIGRSRASCAVSIVKAADSQTAAALLDQDPTHEVIGLQVAQLLKIIKNGKAQAGLGQKLQLFLGRGDLGNGVPQRHRGGRGKQQCAQRQARMALGVFAFQCVDQGAVPAVDTVKVAKAKPAIRQGKVALGVLQIYDPHTQVPPFTNLFYYTRFRMSLQEENTIYRRWAQIVIRPTGEEGKSLRRSRGGGGRHFFLGVGGVG